ncbi:MAG: response regulator transcription factor [Acidobacteria bacterium]|nr:response regulator transcription factor [Acidobacteriota bacterium]
MRVLVVEDEPALADTLDKALTEEDFAVDLARDGEEGLFKMTDVPYDAAVLDVMLPRRDGWSVLKAARLRGVHTPVLILTARDTVEDRVKGLNLGADDYLVKPFALAELVARLHALIRRAYGGDSPRMAIGDLVIDSAAKRVYRQGRVVELTAREFAVLEVLARSKGRLVTRAMLCEHLYNEDAEYVSNVVDVHIAALRRKLGSDVIRTRRGEGYIIDA